MKYAMVILSGAAREPIADLADQSPLEAADAPALRALAADGRVGAVATVPPGVEPSPAVALATLLGADTSERPVSRAALEAAAIDLDLSPGDLAAHVSFVSLDGEGDDAEVLGFDGRPPTHAETRDLLDAVARAWRDEAPGLAGSLDLVPGRDDWGLLIDKGGSVLREARPRAARRAEGRAWTRCVRDENVRTLLRIGREALRDHEVNGARRDAGLRTLDMPWIGEVGPGVALPTFTERFGLRAAIVTGDAAATGLARLMRIDPVPAPGVDAGPGCDLAALGRYASDALDRYDLVIAHVTLTDWLARCGDDVGLSKAIESASREVVEPLRARLETFGATEGQAKPDADKGWRLLVTADLPARCAEAGPCDPAPLAIAGGWVRKVVDRPFTERAALESDLLVDPGYELLEYFLFAGLNLPRKRRFPGVQEAPNA